MLCITCHFYKTYTVKKKCLRRFYRTLVEDAFCLYTFEVKKSLTFFYIGVQIHKKSVLFAFYFQQCIQDSIRNKI